MVELSPITYSDTQNSIRFSCYADTYVYHKVNGKERNLVAMRFGGYPEQVRAMIDTLYKGVSVEAIVEKNSIILYAKNKAYKRSISHDGNYAEAVIQALDDESYGLSDDEQMEVERPENKRKMYIYCEEGNTDSLYSELDKKTSIPLMSVCILGMYCIMKCLLIWDYIRSSGWISLRKATDIYSLYFLQITIQALLRQCVQWGCRITLVEYYTTCL